MDDNHTLSHTTWDCKYHIVFALKYRRRVFYSSNRLEIGQMLRELCKWKGVRVEISGNSHYQGPTASDIKYYDVETEIKVEKRVLYIY